MAFANHLNQAEEIDERNAMVAYEPGELSVRPMSSTDRITANVTINGVDHHMVLEPDATGRYQEVSRAPIHIPDRGCVDPAIFLG